MGKRRGKGKGARRGVAPSKNIQHGNREAIDPSDVEDNKRGDGMGAAAYTIQHRPDPERGRNPASRDMQHHQQSREISSAKFVPLSLVMNGNASTESTCDPPDEGDAIYHPENNDSFPPDADRIEEEEDRLGTVKHHSHNRTGQFFPTHDEHLFGQFNNQTLQQPFAQNKTKCATQHNNNAQHAEDPVSDDDDDEEEEDEEAPLFFAPSDNFNSATDNCLRNHRKGDGWGVDYIKERARRLKKEKREKRRQKMQQLEIEQRRQIRGSRWCWWTDDEWDDMDFDYHHSASRKYRRGRVCNMFIFVLTSVVAIAFIKRDKLLKRDSTANNAKKDRHYEGTKPSSRWGNRFDDDDITGDSETDRNASRYHKHGHNKTLHLTPEQKQKELEKWEEFEMEVSSVLANSGPGWDINTKNGGVKSDENNATESNVDDGFIDHWVQYYDKSSSSYYYFHRESNATQWERPIVGEGVVLVGVAYGTGKEYIIEEGEIIQHSEEQMSKDDAGDGDSYSGQDYDAAAIYTSIVDDEQTDFDAQGVSDRYKDTFWRWNHPYRHHQERTETGGVDAPVFWRIPLSGATTMEEIVTHCYHLIVAGTTGESKDGKKVLKTDITDTLSVVTLPDGAHYMNFDMSTKEGIQVAKKAGLGRSGVADVIMTRYLYNIAELFSDTSHTGRCFTILRHPIDRAVAMYYNLQRNRVKAVSGMSLDHYANSTVVEDNWMIRIITNTMEGKVTQKHLNVAMEVIGRKCLIGLTDKMPEALQHFAKFFEWERADVINRRSNGQNSEEQEMEGKRRCFDKMLKTGVNRHQYKKLDQKSPTWRLLRDKNVYDIQLYKYARELYRQQQVVYQ